MDNYTIQKQEGVEKDRYHTYFDFEDIKMVMMDFHMIRVEKMENIIHDGRESRGIYYYVHAQKKAIKKL